MVYQENIHLSFIFLSSLLLICYSQIHSNYQQVSHQSKVIKIINYQGDDFEMKITLEYMKQFVDYFIVVENQSRFSQQNFNLRKFQEYSYQRIIYVPVRSFPHKETQTQEQERANQKYFQDAPLKVLQLLANPEDLIILSKQHEIISKEVVDFMRKTQMAELCSIQLTFLGFNQSINEKSRFEMPKIFKFKKITNTSESSLFQIKRQSCSHQFQTKNTQINGWKLGKLQTILNKENQLKEKRNNNTINQQFWQALNISINWYKEQVQKSFLFQLKKTIPIWSGKKTRKIFSAFPYNGEQHILKLSSSITSSYVDYYIITQGFYSQCGVAKKLTFNYSSFPEISHKIIYLPLKNMPYTSEKLLSWEKCWLNEFFMRNSAINILKLISFSEDIIITGDCDQMLSRQAVQRFDPNVSPLASTQLRLFYFYFNQQSAYYDQQGRQRPNNGVKNIVIIVFQELMKNFDGNLSKVKIQFGCNTDVLSRLIVEKRQLYCEGLLIQRAGWHFSYVLDQDNLFKKISGSADSAHSFGHKIQNVTQFKTQTIAPGAHNIIIKIDDENLPHQLVKDLIINGKNSVYAPYFFFPQQNYQVKEKSKNITQENEDNNQSEILTKLKESHTQNQELLQQEILEIKYDEWKKKKNEKDKIFFIIQITLIIMIICFIFFFVYLRYKNNNNSQPECEGSINSQYIQEIEEINENS